MLLHAGIGDRRLWDTQVDAFAERYRVIRPDLRGFGETPLPSGPFSYADDVRALLDRLSVEQAAVVGNSFGGRVALDFALGHPERVAALVLVASGVTGREPSAEQAAYDAQEEELLEAGKVEEALELTIRLWVDGPRRGPDAVPAEIRDRVRDMQRRAYEIVLAAYDEEPYPGPVAWAEPPAQERLAEISAPTLVVVGDEDLEEMLAISRDLAREIPGARLTVLAGVAHVPGLERPGEFNRIVLDFLGEASPSRRTK